MNVGDRVFYFRNKALDRPELRRKKGAEDYARIRGKIVRLYQPEQRISALDIEKHFNVSPGTPKFNEFYIGGNRRQLNAIMQSSNGECFMLEEKMWDNSLGDDVYVESIPNSIDFLYGED